MNTLKSITQPMRWLMTFLLVAFVTGCNSGGDGRSTVGITVPTVSSVAPADLAPNIAINTNIAATFSEPMNSSTINSTTFTLMQGTTPITGTVTYVGTTGIFKPTSNLAVSTIYTATITSGAKNLAGNALAAPKTWRFTTGTTTDTIPPTVSSTVPADTATGAALNTNVTAIFSEVMDPTTITSSTFTLKQSTTVIPGAVTYAGTSATFNPTSNLVANASYTATISTGVTDLAGNALTTAKIWSFTTGAALAAGPAPVNLGGAGNFAILSKAGITNTGSHGTAITGNIGSSPITGAAMDNVFCSEITGFIYGANAAYTGSGAVTCFKGLAADNTLVGNAVLDMGTAYTDAAGRPTPNFTELYSGDISGKTLVPGLYKWGTGVSINSNVTLQGGPNDVWIFQIAGDITQASATRVNLTGGALPKNVFWQVGGPTGVAIGTGAHFEGILMAVKAITLTTGASVTGRLLSQTAVTLDANVITQPAP